MPANLKAEVQKVAVARKTEGEIRQALFQDGLLTPANEQPLNQLAVALTAVETLLATLQGRREFNKP